MGNLTAILVTLLLINLLVLAHEGGHFLAARRAGIPVPEFSIGFGWRLGSLRHKETVYSLRVIPLGGYVLLDLPEADDPGLPSADRCTPGKKIMVALGGPLMNLALAVLIFTGIYAGLGLPHYSGQAIIGRVINEMPAQQAGIRSGDIVLSVNHHGVRDWSGLVRELNSLAAGTPCSLLLQRGDRLITCYLTPSREESSGQMIIGVQPIMLYERQGLLAALGSGFRQTFQLSTSILFSLTALVTGALSAQGLAGPIGLASMVGDSLAYGWLELLGFAALLSINLGIFNLLPIPFLDGSRIILGLIEIIRRRALKPEKESLLHLVGLAFLMVLMLYASYNDIVRLL